MESNPAAQVHPHNTHSSVFLSRFRSSELFQMQINIYLSICFQGESPQSVECWHTQSKLLFLSIFDFYLFIFYMFKSEMSFDPYSLWYLWFNFNSKSRFLKLLKVPYLMCFLLSLWHNEELIRFSNCNFPLSHSDPFPLQHGSVHHQRSWLWTSATALWTTASLGMVSTHQLWQKVSGRAEK